MSGALTSATGMYKCAHVTTGQLEEFTRLESAVPETYTSGGYEFDIFAIPAVDLGPIGLMWVMTGGAAVAPTTDLNLMADFIDPYPGTSLLASSDVNAQFDLAVAGAMSVKEATTSRMFTQLDASNPTCANNNGAVPSGMVAFATAPSLGGTPIVTKGQLVTLDLTRDVPVTWSESTGALDYSVVYLIELTNDGGTTGLHTRESITVVTSSTILESSLLASGHTYVLLFVTELGYASASAGNFDSVTYPNGYTTSWSQVFTVQAQ